MSGKTAAAQNLEAIGQRWPVVAGLVLGVVAVQTLPVVILWRFVIKPYLDCQGG